MSCKLTKIFLISAIIVIITGCAAKKPANPDDPYESYNRAMFKFNDVVDSVTLKPIAKVYDKVLPNFAKKRVVNAYSNIGEVPIIINDVLQARAGWAIADFWRLLFNTTLGIGGLFDVATHFGLKKHDQDLGLTFARWGVKHSPYFIVPLLGPSTIRDGVAQFVNFEFFTVYPYIKPMEVGWEIWGAGQVSKRAELLPTDKLIKEAFDPYVFVRSAYLQYRNHLIKEENGGAEDTFVEEDAEYEQNANNAEKAENTEKVGS